MLRPCPNISYVDALRATCHVVHCPTYPVVGTVKSLK